jgi:molybdenum cofactor synthesis domain-containing protein
VSAIAPTPMPLERAETAAAIVIGDEILSGKFAEENAAYLIRELRALGVALRRVVYIPDVIEDIAATVAECARLHDHVFTSGGVGPTHDDLTMEGIARAFGVPVVRDPRLERMLRHFYGARLEERNLRMAEVPEGAHFVEADHPSWPVTAFRNVYILPGVPMIFRRKFDAIKARFRQASVPHVYRVYCMAEEGALAAHLDAIVAEFPTVEVGSYPRFEAVDYRVIVTLESRDPDAALAATERLLARLPAGFLVRVEAPSPPG